jgi:hypothetical protein
MELADAADAVAINAGLQNYFVYYEWMVNENVPTDVTLVIIHSSVRASNVVDTNFNLIVVSPF